MISVIATISLKPGTRTDFLEIFNANVPAVLAEDGCVEYFPAIDVDAKLDAQSKDENAVIVIEKWESLEALHAHLKACLLYTSPSPRDGLLSRMPSSA